MLMKSATVLAVVSCLLYATSIRAEPGPVGRYLMKEPISLFDLGMLKLEMLASNWPNRQAIKEIKAQYGVQPVFIVYYNWDENRIYVQGHIHDFVGDTAKRKLICGRLIAFISDIAGVDPQRGEIYSQLPGYSLFADEFEHRGYSNQAAPKDYKSRLDKIFVIRVFVGEVQEKPISCIRPLLSNAVYFEE